MDLLIAGSREITEPKILDAAFSKVNFNVTKVISGKARGVDTLGEEWAEARGIPFDPYPADWKKYGRAAGHIRNEVMVEKCDGAIILWDGASKGTLGTINLLRKAKKPFYLAVWKVQVYGWDEPWVEYQFVREEFVLIPPVKEIT